MKFCSSLVVISAFSLSACGGGSGGLLTTNNALVSATYEDLQTAGLDVFAARHAEAETFVSDLPSGALTYNGVAAFTATAPNVVATVASGTTSAVDSSFISGVPGDDTTLPNSVAHVEIDVDFAQRTASGSISNIQHQDGYQIEGSLNIKNGLLTGNELAAKFVGNVNEEGSQQLWAGDLNAIFVGSSGQGLYGDFENATTPSGTLHGGFVAQTD